MLKRALSPQCSTALLNQSLRTTHTDQTLACSPATSGLPAVFVPGPAHAKKTALHPGRHWTARHGHTSPAAAATAQSVGLPNCHGSIHALAGARQQAQQPKSSLHGSAAAAGCPSAEPPVASQAPAGQVAAAAEQTPCARSTAPPAPVVPSSAAAMQLQRGAAQQAALPARSGHAAGAQMLGQQAAAAYEPAEVQRPADSPGRCCANVDHGSRPQQGSLAAAAGGPVMQATTPAQRRTSVPAVAPAGDTRPTRRVRCSRPGFCNLHLWLPSELSDDLASCYRGRFGCWRRVHCCFNDAIFAIPCRLGSACRRVSANPSHPHSPGAVCSHPPRSLPGRTAAGAAASGQQPCSRSTTAMCLTPLRRQMVAGSLASFRPTRLVT